MTFKSRFFLAAALLGASATAPLVAQTKTAPKAAAKPAEFTGNATYSAGGLRLDADARGPARVHLPELDASAQSIALDSGADKKVSQVRATGNVNFKLDLTPKDGGAPARIEATCDSAILTTSDRKLVLKGNLKGFYQVAGGAKNTLSGDGATIFYEGKNLVSDLNGGVTLRVPAETLGQANDLGELVISADRARINQADGSATFAGNARAVSTGGANAFDVAAPRFTITRNADGTLGTLKTQGRTLIKLDLPPDPTPTAPTNPPANAPANGAATGLKNIGTPTHIEVAADSATVTRASSTAIFDGNVKGFYRLTQNGTPQNFDFAGSKAIIGYAAVASGDKLAGLNVQVSDAIVNGPAFNLGF